MSDKRLMSIKFKGIDQTYVIPTVIADDANNDGNVVVKNYPSEAYAQHSVDKANPHSVTAEQVGAAPAGYGVGSEIKSLSSADNLHTLKVGGRYGWASDAPQNAPDKYLVMDLMFRDKSGTYGVANFYTTSPFAIYQSFGRTIISDGEWGEFEWENPPLHANKEYRTTERFDDKVIYKKKDSNGKLWYRLDGSDTWIEGLPGAAPSGYGLGEYCKSISMDALDSATINGWYQTSGSITIDNTIMWHPRMFVIAGDAVNLAQELYPISVNEKISNTKLRRRCHDGVWQPWEWENPPMAADVEYRTTERIDGKAVYKKKDSSGQILYRLDGETEWKSQAPLMGAAPAYAKVDATLTTAGWYKVGTIKPVGGDFTTACRIAIGGNYSYDSPPSAIIDVTSDYDSLNAVVTVPALKNKQVTKVGFIRSEMEIFDVYVYYTHSSRNNVYIAVDMLKGTFTKANLESASVSESNMTKVVEPSVSSFAPSGYGLGAHGIYCSDCNSATKNGWYRFDASTLNIAPSASQGSLFVRNAESSSGVIVYQTMWNGYWRAYRFYGPWDNTWTEWEFENPPMQLWVEYRTTERYQGKVVYTMLVDCGACPDTSDKIVSTTIPSSATTIRYFTDATNSAGNHLGNTPTVYETGAIVCRTTVRSDNKIGVKSYGAYTDINIMCQVWYVKD